MRSPGASSRAAAHRAAATPFLRYTLHPTPYTLFSPAAHRAAAILLIPDP